MCYISNRKQTLQHGAVPFQMCLFYFVVGGPRHMMHTLVWIRRMDGWMHSFWVDGWVGGLWVGGWMVDGMMEGMMDGMDGWMDGWVE